MTPEAKARQSIDALLEQAGWHVCDMADANIHASRGVALREFPLNAGFGCADYLLHVDGRAAGVIEAKKAGSTLTGVEVQVDGAITVQGTTYLEDFKFTAFQADATNVDRLLAKVGNVADNTMGLMVSMSGNSSVAAAQASGKKTPLILLVASHVMSVLYSGWRLGKLMARLCRQVSQTGEASLDVAGLQR